MPAIEARCNRAFRTVQRLGDLLVGESLHIFQQYRHSQLGAQSAYGMAHRIRELPAQVAFLLRRLCCHMSHLDLLAKRDKAPELSLLIGAAVSDYAIEPCREFRIVSKLSDDSKELQENLLTDVAGGRFITAEMEGDRVDAVLIGLEQRVKGASVTLLARLDDGRFLWISHYREL